MYLLLILVILAFIFVFLKTFKCSIKCNEIKVPKICEKMDNYPTDNYTYFSKYLIPNLKNKNSKNISNSFQTNNIEVKDYILKEDCFWNNKCNLAENNQNFFKYN